MTDRWCLAQVWIRRASDERRRALTSTAFVSEEKETSARGRLVGIARAVHRRPRLRVSFSISVCFLLVVVLWCVGNPDLWDRGSVCFWGTFLLWLVYPNLPIAGHKLVPESHSFIRTRGEISVHMMDYLFRGQSENCMCVCYLQWVPNRMPGYFFREGCQCQGMRVAMKI